MDMISDIVERTDTGPVSAPQAPSAPSGAPPRPKSSKLSAWRDRQATRKRQQSVPQPSSGPSSSSNNLQNSKIANALSQARPASKPGFKGEEQAPEFSEAERIHIENLERLSHMTEQEIEQERETILGSMDVGVLQGLLRRAEMREGGEGNEFGAMDETQVAAALNPGAPPVQPKKTVAFKEPDQALEKVQDQAPKKVQEQAPKKDLSTFSIADVGVDGLVDGSERYPSFEQLQKLEAELDEAEREKLGASNVHFQRPANTTNTDDLDPADPDFFTKLHDKYYPSLDAEPAKLAWMQPLPDTNDEENLEGLLPSELRFDFQGHLVSPRLSAGIPVHAGLHHHGDSPAAAGYTVLELAHLARSAHSGQRAMAIQTLGRVLFRLGSARNEYGREISAGLRGLVDEARVVQSLEEAADEQRTRSVTVRAYAVEALWLWRQSGGVRQAV